MPDIHPVPLPVGGIGGDLDYLDESGLADYYSRPGGDQTPPPKRVLVIGGGDTALDWALRLLPIAKQVILADVILEIE